MPLVLILSAIIANAFGVRLHYVHKPTTKSLLVHCLVAVNESTWEHLKLAFTPMVVISFVQYFILRAEYSNIFEANLYAVVGAILFIPVIYYPVKFFTKREILWVSITLFVLAICFGYLLSYLALTNNIQYIGELPSVILMGVLLILFSIFTFYPPRIFLFWDPITKRFGHSLKQKK